MQQGHHYIVTVAGFILGQELVRGAAVGALATLCNSSCGTW
jgi:hypothetical protein